MTPELIDSGVSICVVEVVRMRTVRFGLLLSEREREALARLTEAEGELSKSVVVRRLIRREAKRRGLLLPVDQPAPAQSEQGQVGAQCR
jgi:hypothetical protein